MEMTIPLEPTVVLGDYRAIRKDVDEGKPTVVADPEGRIALNYREIARRTAAKLSKKKKDFSAAFPNIVIDNS